MDNLADERGTPAATPRKMVEISNAPMRRLLRLIFFMMPKYHHRIRVRAAKKQQRRLWSWAATLVGGVPSAPSKVAGWFR